MFSSLYPISFVLSLASLSGWFFYRDNAQRSAFFQKFFLGSFASFGLSWLMADGEFGYKLPALLRELLIMGTVPVLLSAFRRNRWAFIAVLLATLGTMRLFYFEKLKATFPQAHPTAEKKRSPRHFAIRCL